MLGVNEVVFIMKPQENQLASMEAFIKSEHGILLEQLIPTSKKRGVFLKIEDNFYKICSDKKDLSNFLMGNYNKSKNLSTPISLLDEAEMDKFILLFNFSIYLKKSYDKTSTIPESEQIIRGINGEKYFVIEVFGSSNDISEQYDALLVGTDDFAVKGCYGLEGFRVSFDFDKKGLFTSTGFSWQSERYFGKVNAGMDFQTIIAKAFNVPTEGRNVFDYRKYVMEEYLALQKIITNQNLDKEIKIAAERCIERKFNGYSDFGKFFEALSAGAFDKQYKLYHTERGKTV